jgi:CRP-like cAMP-binding protein
LRGWLADALGSAEYADRLAKRCTRIEVQPGQDIARQGEPSDSMHFILEGRVGIFVGMDGGRMVRVRSLGRHTTIGEMGLITGRPRRRGLATFCRHFSVIAWVPSQSRSSDALRTFLIRAANTA